MVFLLRNAFVVDVNSHKSININYFTTLFKPHGDSLIVLYSPFHSSLPFEHLGQSNLFTRVCRLFVCKSDNFLFYFRTETVSQVPDVLKIYSAFVCR